MDYNAQQVIIKVYCPYPSDSKMKTFNDVYHLLDTDYNQIVQLERYTKLLDRLNKNVYYLSDSFC